MTELICAGGGKIHHLNMEGEMWYKQNPAGVLKTHKLQVISEKQRSTGSGSVLFKDICPSYGS